MMEIIPKKRCVVSGEEMYFSYKLEVEEEKWINQIEKVDAQTFDGSCGMVLFFHEFIEYYNLFTDKILRKWVKYIKNGTDLLVLFYQMFIVRLSALRNYWSKDFICNLDNGTNKEGS